MEKLYGIEFETIETERLILRELNPQIIKKIYLELYDELIMTLLGIESIEELESTKINNLKGIETHWITFKKWLIILKETDEIIGSCSYHTWKPLHFKAEIGYQLKDDKYKKKGYMSEAFAEIIKHGFEKMNLNRIDAYISPWNVASRALVEKNGFKIEGCHKEDYFINNKFEDSIIYALLKKEYNEKKEN